MSTKTLRKRIALVAVSALGAGVLVASPSIADDNGAVGGSNATAATGILNVATEPSITGAAVLGSNGALSGSKSLGLLANSVTQTTSSVTSTATMRADGAIVFAFKGSATAEIGTTVEISGGTIGAFSATSSAATNMNPAKTSLVVVKDAAADLVTNFSVVPNTGATTVTVSVYESAALGTNNSASLTDAVAAAAIQAGTTSKGTLKQRYVVTVATTSASGTYSAAESLVNVDADGSGSATGIDEANANIIANGSAGYINVNLLDPYGVSLDGVGALVVTGTNGAGIKYNASGGAATPVNITDVSNDTSGTITVARPTAMANKGFSTNVTITWNGAVVATKSFTFLGEVASMVVTPRRIAATKSGVSNADTFRVTYADSAGNSLIGLGTTATTVVSSTTTTVVTGASIGTQGTATDAAKGTLACAAGTSDYLAGGTAQLQLQHVNTSGSIVKSNVWTATCQGNAYSYTASFDKASYTPGSIATLTITFKDRDGDLANGMDPVGTTAGGLIAITGGPSATAVTIPADGDKADSGTGLAGTKTYQFIVGTTEGDFQAVVSAPLINSRNSSQTNQTVSYSVKASSSAVSNADVLKAIVSLIASINKQIAALQKALLKR